MFGIVNAAVNLAEEIRKITPGLQLLDNHVLSKGSLEARHCASFFIYNYFVNSFILEMSTGGSER